MAEITKLEDMSETERQSWATLIVDVCVLAWFLNKTTYSLTSLTLRETQAGTLVGIYIGVIIVTIILHSVIAGIFALRERADHSHAKDERDINIERRGAASGYWVVAIAINVIIATLLLEYAAAQGADTVFGDYRSPISVLSPPFMFFALMITAFLGDIVKNAVMVAAYRRA